MPSTYVSRPQPLCYRDIAMDRDLLGAVDKQVAQASRAAALRARRRNPPSKQGGLCAIAWWDRLGFRQDRIFAVARPPKFAPTFRARFRLRVKL